MIFYLLIAAFIGGGLLGGGAINWYHDAQEARLEAAQAKAQKTIDDQAKKITDDAADKLVDMQASWDAGVASVKPKEKIVYQTAQQFIVKNPPPKECVTAPEGMSLLNAARAAAADALGVAVVITPPVAAPTAPIRPELGPNSAPPAGKPPKPVPR